MLLPLFILFIIEFEFGSRFSVSELGFVVNATPDNEKKHVGHHGGYDDDYEKTFYQFGYEVNDHGYSQDYHGHMEHNEGSITKGEYKVELPDGRIQVVSYVADDYGFRPVISYLPSGRIIDDGGRGGYHHKKENYHNVDPHHHGYPKPTVTTLKNTVNLGHHKVPYVSLHHVDGHDKVVPAISHSVDHVQPKYHHSLTPKKHLVASNHENPKPAQHMTLPIYKHFKPSFGPKYQPQSSIYKPPEVDILPPTPSAVVRSRHALNALIDPFLSVGTTHHNDRRRRHKVEYAGPRRRRLVGSAESVGGIEFIRDASSVVPNKMRMGSVVALHGNEHESHSTSPHYESSSGSGSGQQHGSSVLSSIEEALKSYGDVSENGPKYFILSIRNPDTAETQLMLIKRDTHNSYQ